MRLHVLSAIVFGGILVGCGDQAPQTSDDALQQLTEGQRAAFERWKGQLVKGCDGAQAFGLQSAVDTEPGIDIALLMAQNNNSLLVRDGDAAVLLERAQAWAGSATSKVDECYSSDGRETKLQAELRRQEYTCEVYLYGQKVHEVTLAAGFTVAAFWQTGVTATAAQAQPRLRETSAKTASIGEHGLVAALAEALRPRPAAHTLLAKHFGLPEATIAGIFRLESAVSLPFTARVVDEPDVLWFNAPSPDLVGPPARLKPLVDDTEHTLVLDTRMALPALDVGTLKNTADRGVIKLEVVIATAATASNQALSYVSCVHGADIADWDPLDANTCVLQRTRVLMTMSSRDPLDLQPSASAALSPCGVLSEDLNAQIVNDGTLRALIPEVFIGRDATPRTAYNGWDILAMRLALACLDNGEDVRAALDASGSVTALQNAGANLMVLHELMQATQNLSKQNAAILRMGMSWAFVGTQVAEARMQNIVAAADNSIVPFEESTLTLLRALIQKPNDNDDAIAFAAGLDTRYKELAQQILHLATSLNYGAWQQDYFDAALQKRLSLAELAAWQDLFVGIQGELAKYENLDGVKETLVTLAVEKIRAGEADLLQIGRLFGQVNNAVEPFSDSVRAVLRDLRGSNLTVAQPALEFASALDARYKAAAVAVRDGAIAVGQKDWAQTFFSTVLQARPSLQQVNRWQQTLQAAAQFNHREQDRLRGESEIHYAWGNRDLMQAALAEFWEDGDFHTVEAIANLGRTVDCDGYRAVSSVVYCVGSSRFSKQQKNLLDPTFGGRYGTLATEFTAFLDVLVPEHDNLSSRRSLSGKFFASPPVWASCFGHVYDEKVTAARQQVQAIAGTRDTFKRWELERALEDTLSDCR